MLHGWPQAIGEDHSLVKLLKKRNYVVFTPFLLEMKPELNIKNTLSRIEDELAGKKPDLIIGMSMSGFLIPYIAKKYPEAGVVLIATAARFRSKSKFFGGLVFLIGSGFWGEGIVYMLLRTAPTFMRWWYKQLTSNGKSGKYLQSDIDKSVKELALINPRKHYEAARMIWWMDNREIWQSLANRTLVLSGHEDIIMPEEAGRELAGLIKNCSFMVTHASHYNVLNRETYPVIDKFLSER